MITEIASRIALVLGGWAAIMLAMPMLGPPGRQVAIIGDAGQSIAAVRATGGEVVDIREGVILARSDRSGFALALYRAGAPLVIEGRIASGCLSRR